jgi:hypothetical protein
MATQLETQVHNVLKSRLEGRNDLHFMGKWIRCRNSTVNISQSNIFEIVSKLVADSTLENIVKNRTMNDITAAIKQTTEQVNAGLDFGLGLIVLVFLVIAGIFILPKLMKGAGGGADGKNLQDTAMKKDPRMRVLMFVKNHKMVLFLGAILVGLGIWLALMRAGVVTNVFLPPIAR